MSGIAMMMDLLNLGQPVAAGALTCTRPYMGEQRANMPQWHLDLVRVGGATLPK
jgi:hypothetical protein